LKKFLLFCCVESKKFFFVACSLIRLCVERDGRRPKYRTLPRFRPSPRKGRKKSGSDTLSDSFSARINLFSAGKSHLTPPISFHFACLHVRVYYNNRRGAVVCVYGEHMVLEDARRKYCFYFVA
jgi:hypothetical protein